MNAKRVPFEAPKERIVGYASEGSACLREAASAKAGRPKHVEGHGLSPVRLHFFCERVHGEDHYSGG